MRLRVLLFTLLLALSGHLARAQTNLTANNQCATINVEKNVATMGIQVTGTWSATLQPEVAIAGQTAVNTQVTPSTSNTAQATITANGGYIANVAGYQSFSVCVTAYTSGTVSIFFSTSQGVSISRTVGVTGSGITAGVKGEPLIANGPANTLVPSSSLIDITPFLPVAPASSTDLCPYINAATTLNPFSVIDLRGLPVRTYCNFPMVTPANGQTSVIASVATSSGGSAVYTGTFPFGASNFYANPGCSIAAISAQTVAFCKVVITGFVGGNNNGTFTVSASTTTTITVNNASATTESAAATGVLGGGGNFSGKLLQGYTAFFLNSYAGYQSFGSGNNLEGEGRVNSAGSIPYVPGTGTDYELCSAVGTEMAASDFTNVCGSVAMQTAIVSTDTNNYPAIISMNSYPATSGAVGVSGTTALAARISGISVGCGMLANTTAFGNYNAQEGSKFDNNYVHDCSSTADIGFDLGGGTGGAQNFWLTDFQINTLSGKTNVASAVGIRVWTATGNGVPSIIEKGSVVNNSAVGTSPNYDFEYVGGTTGIGSLVMIGNHWESAGVAGIAIGVATVKGVDQGGAANGLIATGETCGPGFGNAAGSGCFVIFNGTIGTGTAAATNISILSSLATGAGAAPLNLITDQNNTSIPVATKFISRYETNGTGIVLADTSGTNTSTFAGSITATKFNGPIVAFNPQTTTYQVLAADFAQNKIISVASGAFTITLVASGSQPAAGQCIRVLNYGSGNVTVARSGQNINGVAGNLSLAAVTTGNVAPDVANICSDGANYFADLSSLNASQLNGKNFASPAAIGTSTPAAVTATNILLNAQVLSISSTAPTISSGFGTSPSISANNGTAAFRVNVGTGGAATTGVVGLPAATTGWNCTCTDITTNSTSVFLCKQTASSTTTATVGNFSDVAAAAAWTASDILAVSCFAY